MPRVSRINANGPQLPQQRVKPVQERSRKKIDAILDATAQLLERYGIEAVSTSAIAEAAGIPVATVYHYFENRLAVFAALAERTISGVDDQLESMLGTLGESAEPPDWRALLALLYTAYQEAPGYTQVLRALKAEPALQSLVQESNLRIAQVLAGVLLKHTALPEARAQRVAWIMSELCEIALQKALVEGVDEACALQEEMGSMVDCLFAYYVSLTPEQAALPKDED